ncbi:MAG: LPS export ABC transporter ATP-binding protein, partial [Fimbriiglobus sp.]
MALLEVTGLEKWYGHRKVVDGVSYNVAAGEVVGLLGANGAGKTTSFRMTTGQIAPNGGRVAFDGQDVTELPMFRRARLGMGYLSQEPSIFRKLSVEQNLIAILEALPRSRSLGRKLTRTERWDRTEEALTKFNLLHVRKNTAARCSGGEKRRLEIARCLVCEPLLILLDEPFAAVDPITTEDIRHNIRDLAKSGIGILLTDHNVREVLKITDRSYLIQAGQVVTQGTPSELIRDPIAIREYLGSTFADDVAMMQYPVAGTPGITGNAGHYRPAEVILTPVPPPPAPVPQAASAPPAARWTPPPPRPMPELAFPPSATSPAPPAPVGPAPLFSSPPAAAAGFSGSAQQLLEEEKMRRLVEQLREKTTVERAIQELTARGRAAVPVLLEALERRELDIRHLAFRLLGMITGEDLMFQSDAPEDVRLRQVAYLRAKLERR